MAEKAAKTWRNMYVVDPTDGDGVCRCGEIMIEEITIVPPPEKRFLTCKAFKDDGLHCRKPWDLAMCGEVARLARIVLNQVDVVGFLEGNDQNVEIATLKEIVSRVATRMNTIFPKRCYSRKAVRIDTTIKRSYCSRKAVRMEEIPNNLASDPVRNEGAGSPDEVGSSYQIDELQ